MIINILIGALPSLVISHGRLDAYRLEIHIIYFTFMGIPASEDALIILIVFSPNLMVASIPAGYAEVTIVHIMEMT